LLALASAAECPNIQYGDVNGDCRVDVDDTLTAIDAFAGRFDATRVRFTFADIATAGHSSGQVCPNGVVGDGKITLEDVQAVNDAFSGRLPSGCPNLRARPCTTNQNPVAQAGADAETWPGEDLSFDARGSDDPDGTIVAYRWSFGVGSQGDDPNPAACNSGHADCVVEYSYDRPGLYTATLMVTDGCSGTHSDQRAVRVCDATPPRADGGADRMAIVNTVVAFDASASTSANGFSAQDLDVQYFWSFGDGGATNWQRSPRAEHRYTAEGDFSVVLWVRDNCGVQSAEDRFTVSVRSTAGDGPALSPRLLGYVQGNIGTVRGVALSPAGNRLYVASLQFGVIEFDVSDPANPEYSRASKNFEGTQGVWVNASVIMTGGPTNRVRVVPLSTLGTPAESWVSLGFVAQDIAFKGNLAVVAAGPAGLKLVDVSNPASPQVTATVQPLFARGVVIGTVNGADHAFVAAGPDGFRVVRLGQNPVVVGSVDPLANGSSTRVTLDGTGKFAYVCEYGGGLSVINVSDPVHPVRLRTLTTFGAAYRVTRTGDLLAVAGIGDPAAIEIYDVGTDPANPRRLGYYSSNSAVDLAAKGDFVYAAADFAGVVVIDINDTGRPSLLATMQTGMGSPSSIATNGLLTVVGGASGSTMVYDVEDDAAPVKVAQIVSTAQDIAIYDYRYQSAGRWVEETRAYLAAGQPGLRVVDLNNPAQPTIRWTTSMFAKGIALSSDGQYAFVAADMVAGTGGRVNVVRVFDPANPLAAPRIESQVTTSAVGRATKIALSDDERFAYVADYSGGLQVLDVTGFRTGRTPTKVGSGFVTVGAATHVALANGLVVVTTSDPQTAQLSLLDVSDPVRIVQVGSFSGTVVGRFDSYEHYLLVPTISMGLAVVDLSNPGQLRTVHSIRTPSQLFSAVRFGNLVYAGDVAAGLDVFELFPN
jgi:hypothetical protein